MARMIRFYRDVLGFEIKEAEDTRNVYLASYKRTVENGAIPVLEPTTEPWG